MKAIDFPQRNALLAEHQPEYETLPVYCEMKEVVNAGGSIEQLPWSMTACFELSEEEIAEIVATKKMFYTQMLFGNNFQPVRMSIKNPFE